MGETELVVIVGEDRGEDESMEEVKENSSSCCPRAEHESAHVQQSCRKKENNNLTLICLAPIVHVITLPKTRLAVDIKDTKPRGFGGVRSPRASAWAELSQEG